MASAVSADLTRERIAHAISGSIAMAAHGYVRSTLDVDLLVAAPSTRLPRVFELVRAHGFTGADRDLIVDLREQGVATLRNGPLAIEILVPMIPYHQTLIERAVHIRIEGADVPFVSLEDLVLLKLVWARTKDLADLEALVGLGGARLNVPYLKSTLATLIPSGDARFAHLDRLLG